MTPPLLALRDLRVGLTAKGRGGEIVRGVSFDVERGEKVAVVGESGSGKTLTMLSIVGLLASPPLTIRGGEIRLEGEDLRAASQSRLREVRGGEIAMIYQDPMSSLNPLLRVDAQIREALTAHGVARDVAQRRALEALGHVGLVDPDRVGRSYPHQLSGGMIQRVMIAMALATAPRLLIADEPTTALDVTIQRQILDLVSELQRDTGMAIVWVTHDLGVVASLVDRVLVMYAGRVVESATTAQLFARPTHPYTASLLGSLPGPESAHRSPLRQIDGTPPDPTRLEPGCPFRARCPYAVAPCAEREPDLIDRGHGSLAACWREPEQW